MSRNTKKFLFAKYFSRINSTRFPWTDRGQSLLHLFSAAFFLLSIESYLLFVMQLKSWKKGMGHRNSFELSRRLLLFFEHQSKGKIGTATYWRKIARTWHIFFVSVLVLLFFLQIHSSRTQFLTNTTVQYLCPSRLFCPLSMNYRALKADKSEENSGCFCFVQRKRFMRSFVYGSFEYSSYVSRFMRIVSSQTHRRLYRRPINFDIRS